MSNISNFTVTEDSQIFGRFSVDTLPEFNQTHKILFSGSDTEAKQLALRAVSDIPLHHIDLQDTEETAAHQIDYGYLALEAENNLHLYGVTITATQDTLWPQLSVGGLGLVLIMDNQRPNPLADLAVYLDAFADFIEKNAIVIGVTHIGEPHDTHTIDLADYQAFLNQRGHIVPVFEFDTHQANDVKVLLQAMLHMLDNDWLEN